MKFEPFSYDEEFRVEMLSTSSSYFLDESTSGASRLCSKSYALLPVMVRNAATLALSAVSLATRPC